MVYIKCYSYIYIIMNTILSLIMDPLFILGVLVVLLIGVGILMTLLGIFVLTYFPNSKLSDWFRGNIITDKDLEP
jgi:hypothetical protein